MHDKMSPVNKKWLSKLNVKKKLLKTEMKLTLTKKIGKMRLAKNTQNTEYVVTAFTQL